MSQLQQFLSYDEKDHAEITIIDNITMLKKSQDFDNIFSNFITQFNNKHFQTKIPGIEDVLVCNLPWTKKEG